MPNYTPPRLMILSLAAMISLSACATVDVTGFGASPEKVSVNQPVETGNVITRSVKRLYDVFVDRGIYEDSSRKRVQSATNILLNGLQTPDASVETVAAREATQSSKVLDNIQTARYHIVQTTKAAEVYLEIASHDASLTNELKLLQKALRVSEQAAEQFAANDMADRDDIGRELSGLMHEIDGLRTVTDSFGDVVRARQIARSTSTYS